MGASLDTATLVTATGLRATRTVATVDDIEPELVGFVRSAVRWLDPRFPQTGLRDEGGRGGWIGDDQVETEMTQFEELAHDGRGVRIIRLHRMTPVDGAYEGAIRIIALGVANEARLELRWNFVASEIEVRGTSALLIVEGARESQCIADFVSWFDGN
ncbi:MAG: hypothetical protein ABI867_02700 [Kofleriaceae bacterium]